MEIRIRGKDEFVMKLLQHGDVVKEMLDAKYITTRYAPFQSILRDSKSTGVTYFTKKGILILDDLSRLSDRKRKGR